MRSAWHGWAWSTPHHPTRPIPYARLPPGGVQGWRAGSHAQPGCPTRGAPPAAARQLHLLTRPRLYHIPDYILPQTTSSPSPILHAHVRRPALSHDRKRLSSRALLSHPRVNQPRAFWVVIFTGKLGFIAGSSCNVVWCWVGAGGLHTQQQTAARFQSSTSRNKPPVVPPFLVTVIGVDSPRETPPHQASASPVVLL